MKTPTPFGIPLLSLWRYYLHHSPRWVGRLPLRLRWKVATWLGGRPGICWASAADLALYGETHGISAARCGKDGFPCWCGKYNTPGQLRRDMERTIRDPLDDVLIVFHQHHSEPKGGEQPMKTTTSVKAGQSFAYIVE